MSSSRACLVTGYVRLDLPNRPHEDYVSLGRRLVGTAEEAGHAVVVGEGSVHDCWHWRMSDGCRLPDGNPDKDTRAFHSVQHEKTAWLADAAEHTDAEILVWMDYGLLHVPGITRDSVAAFLARAAGMASRERVGMASIWGVPGFPCLPSRVAWHCAGGVFTCPRHLAGTWHECVRQEAIALRARGWATWEVNTWADAWRRNPHLVTHWLCDHDASLLENGP